MLDKNMHTCPICKKTREEIFRSKDDKNRLVNE
jgi:hypothetical protein